jgi:multicomponent Na+:H+ antiporter subunit C
MTWAFTFAIFASITAGVYLALSRDALRVALGLAVLGNAVNLLLFAAGRVASAPAVVPAGATALDAGAANPLPQALVLTAIVIGFALVCFSLVLVLRLIRDAGSDDAHTLRHAEPPADDPARPALPQPGCEPAWPPAPETASTSGAER